MQIPLITISRSWPASSLPFWPPNGHSSRALSSRHLNVVGRRRRLYTHYSSAVVDRAPTNPSAAGPANVVRTKFGQMRRRPWGRLNNKRITECKIIHLKCSFLDSRCCKCSSFPLNLISGLDKLTEVDAVAWTLRWVFFDFKFLISSHKLHWEKVCYTCRLEFNSTLQYSIVRKSYMRSKCISFSKYV